MSQDELERLVDGWIALQKVPVESDSYDSMFWAYESVWNLVAAKPREALEFILAVLRREASAVVIENLSAGPLEDLLAGHGDLMVGQVEDEAKRNPLFSSLLGGVWKGRIDDLVWKRVVAVRNRSG